MSPKVTDGASAFFLLAQSLESLTERCKSALCLLGEALRSMDSEPVPDNIKVQKMWFGRPVGTNRFSLMRLN